MYQKLVKEAKNLQEQLVHCRRDLHKYAETGWLEMRTSSLIARRLKDLGYEVLTGTKVCKEEARMGLPPKEVMEEHYAWAQEHGACPEFLPQTAGGHTGVIGILRCGEGPVIALRFDMDALGVFECGEETHKPVREDFRSLTEGVMHACGHDGHITIGLGAAELLASVQDQLAGTVKIIFQPAEEGVRGARSIVENGHLDDVDYVLASHLAESPDGSFQICPGLSGTLATSKLDAYFKGKSAHAGLYPQEGQNALLAAATAALNLHAIPRHGEGSSRVNVGTLHAGSGRNVICDQAKLEIEVRGETTAINTYMEQYTIQILESAAAMHGCTLEVTRMGGAAAMACTPALVERLRKVCEEKLHLETGDPKDMGGSEDFAYMTQRVIEKGGQACFTGIQIPCASAFHSRQFDFDEHALSLGAAYYAGVVWDLLGKKEG